MEKVKIFHNTRCRKSRESLDFLNSKNNLKVEVINYLENSPSKEELIKILEMLNIPAIDLVRKSELIYKEKVKKFGRPDEETAIDWMVKFPKLIERPIVIYKNKAVIGRPLEKVEELFI